MDSAPAMGLIREHFTVSGKVYVVPDADHHIYIDNPQHLSRAILFDCFKGEEDLVDIHDTNGIDDIALTD